VGLFKNGNGFIAEDAKTTISLPKNFDTDFLGRENLTVDVTN
jgi:hypothetical protein